MIRKRVRIDSDLDIYCEMSGSGSNAILMVPGWTMSTQVFERQLAHFEHSEEYCFITYDPRSHGLSSKPESGHYYQKHGQDLAKLIDALDIDRILLGGWSFGTLEILAYVNQFGSERLAGLLMLDGPPRAAAEDNKSDWASYRYDDADGSQAFYTLGRLQQPDVTNETFVRWLLEDKSNVETIDWLLEITRQMPDNHAALLNASAVFVDYSDDLMALNGKKPLCYLVRENLKQAVTEWRDKNTPDAEVIAFGEHLMFWEQSERFNRSLIDFANRCHF